MDLLGFSAQSPPFTVIAAAVLVLASAIAYAGRRRRQYPPGPSRLDVIISGLFNYENHLRTKRRWRAKFGKVYTALVGREHDLIMTDYDVIHNVFVNNADVSSSRPPGLGVFLAGVADKGIIPSPDWREQRRFALTVLREQGMGKINMEQKILEEVGPFLQEIEKRGDRPTMVDGCVHQAVSNVICSLVLGSRFEYDDPIFVSLLDKFLNQVQHVRKMSVIKAFPILQWLPGDVFGYRKYTLDALKNREYFLAAIRQHEAKLDRDNPMDFIDAYLIEIKSRAEAGQPSSFDEINCLATVIQLFVAGTDTTANTLHWAWLFMALHPEIQKKVWDEIQARIGSRQPSLADRAAMPYAEAVLAEVLRLANTVVSSLPHVADESMTIGGYTIPKGTILTASLSDVHLDDSIYPNPTQFDPTRFLNSDGRYEKPKKFVPFGIGRRVCLGESLARAELFLFFISALQNFSVECPPGGALVPKGKVGFIHKPIPQPMVFRKRQ